MIATNFPFQTGIDRVAKRRLPIIMFVLTACYLALELGFNSRLVDVLGSDLTPDDVHGIEQWGRVISGFAVALLLCGAVAAYSAKAKQGDVAALWRLGAVCVLLTAVTVPAVYWAEKSFVDGQVADQNAELRQFATYTSLARKHLLENHSIEGFDFDERSFDEPAGKVFVSLFAYYYHLVVQDTEIRREIVDEVISEMSVLELMKRARLRNYKGPLNEAYVESYNKVYTKAVRSVQQDYNDDFIEKREQYRRSISPAAFQDKFDEAWSEYISQLAERRWTPDTVPRRFHGRVREQVNSTFGLRLPADWALNDRRRFEDAVGAVYQREVKSAWRDGVCRLIRNMGQRGYEGNSCSRAIPPTVSSFQEFWNLKVIQDEIKERLELEHLRHPISANWTLAQWREFWWNPKLNDVRDAYNERFSEDTESYERGKKNFCVGRNASYAISVPHFALSVSISGAIYHSSKLIYYFLLVLFPASVFQRYLVSHLLIFGLGFTAFFHWTSSQEVALTQTPGFQSLASIVEEDRGVAETAWTKFVIQSQTAVYPIGHQIHQYWLGAAPFEAFDHSKTC